MLTYVGVLSASKTSHRAPPPASSDAIGPRRCVGGSSAAFVAGNTATDYAYTSDDGKKRGDSTPISPLFSTTTTTTAINTSHLAFVGLGLMGSTAAVMYQVGFELHTSLSIHDGRPVVIPSHTSLWGLRPYRALTSNQKRSHNNQLLMESGFCREGERGGLITDSEAPICTHSGGKIVRCSEE